MRASHVLQKLHSGDVICCFKLNLSCARVIEIPAMFGFDCIWLDMEHTANDWSVIEKQINTAKAYSIDTMVRVARGGYSDYIRPLELDASGIMVPHIMSLKDAKDVVRMTRFHPIGRRPVDGGNADGAYANIEFKEYIRQANERRFIVVQIEDPEPLNELDAIASLEGIDIIFFGPSDFSQGIGAPGEWEHSKIKETRKRVADVCLSHGKFAGTGGTLTNLEEIVKMGYRFINFGADVIGVSHYCKDLMAEFRKRTALK
ncbi:aldolase [Candidatus Peregrinibacteria bacterium]|nr:aldolase [Candidatus Peregrinibacteria bacterium]